MKMESPRCFSVRHSSSICTAAQVFVLTLSIGPLGLLSVGCDKREESKQDKPALSGITAPADSSSVSGASPAAGDKPAQKPSAHGAAKIVSPLPGEELVQPVVNPKKSPPYSGPTGVVRGLVKASGDKPPALPDVLKKMDSNCVESREVFGVLFREGKQRELADVLVAVTHYDGYVPSQGKEVVVTGKGCAWDVRTVALTYGQRIDVHGADKRPYVPELLGQPMPAQLFVLPTAPPVQLPPKKPGRYQLVDSMRLFNVADVFVLPYATFDVTGVDGSFEIKGVPVGEVEVNALLPQTGATKGKKVKVEADKVTEVTFELPFDRMAWEKKPKPTPLDELPGPDDPR